MAIYWDQYRVRYHMLKHGIDNPSQLAAFAKITKPTAARVLAGALIDRIDAGILESLAIAFDLSVGSLLVQRPPLPRPKAPAVLFVIPSGRGS